MNFKKGMIYTISVFILAVVLLELLSYSVQHNDRHLQYFLPPTEGEMLALRLDELSFLTAEALGVDAQMERNSTHLLFYMQDSGFPLTPASNGRAFISQHKSWVEMGWTNISNCLVDLDVSIPNSTGRILSATSGLNYTQNNSLAANDSAALSIENGINISSVAVNIYCLSPPNTALVTYNDWPSDGTWRRAEIVYSDDTAFPTHVNSVLFNQGNVHYFAANYYDGDGDWMQSVHVDWAKPNYTLNISASTNASYTPSITKQDVSCTWNISLSLNYTNYTKESFYIPINTTLAYQNSTYKGYLILARK
ncbi:MAG: hypothetical protein ABIH83_04310 [Candidatus Micrarchaeota archaeon]